jgi:ligand-binding SRPBCC domain-containing protein
MTTLTNRVAITAPREAVWRALTTLDLLDQYDPGVRASTVVGDRAEGLGARRRCELRPTGWFVEQVVTWEPMQALAFELVSCSLPVAQLRHDYTLSQEGTDTVVTQVMTYDLKYGPAARVLDAVMMRRQWDRGIKGFLAGLQHHVESHATA